MEKSRRYNGFTSFIKKRFGIRVQKVCINAGFTCPNKDGSKGVGGCTYCNNNTFNPDYRKPIKPIKSPTPEPIAILKFKGIPSNIHLRKGVILISVNKIPAQKTAPRATSHE